MSYSCAPWATALEILYKIVRMQWDRAGADAVVLNPLLCNIVSCAERVLAFHVTGNWRVLVRRVMDPLWITLSILKTGYACLHPNYIINRTAGFVCTDPQSWPMNAKTGNPYSAVEASILFTYGANVNDVSLFESLPRRSRTQYESALQRCGNDSGRTVDGYPSGTSRRHAQREQSRKYSHDR